MVANNSAILVLCCGAELNGIVLVRADVNWHIICRKDEQISFLRKKTFNYMNALAPSLHTLGDAIFNCSWIRPLVQGFDEPLEGGYRKGSWVSLH